MEHIIFYSKRTHNGTMMLGRLNQICVWGRLHNPPDWIIWIYAFPLSLFLCWTFFVEGGFRSTRHEIETVVVQTHANIPKSTLIERETYLFTACLFLRGVPRKELGILFIKRGSISLFMSRPSAVFRSLTCPWNTILAVKLIQEGESTHMETPADCASRCAFCRS